MIQSEKTKVEREMSEGVDPEVETGEEVNEVEVDPGEGAVVGRGGADPVEADLGEADLDEADLGEDPDLDTEDLEAGGNTGGDLGVEEVPLSSSMDVKLCDLICTHQPFV